MGSLGGRNSPPAYFAEHVDLAFLLRISLGGNYSEVILMERRDVSETAKVYHVVEIHIDETVPYGSESRSDFNSSFVFCHGTTVWNMGIDVKYLVCARRLDTQENLCTFRQHGKPWRSP